MFNHSISLIYQHFFTIITFKSLKSTILNATDFNRAMAERLGTTQAEASSQIESLVEIMKKAFEERDSITLTRFGVFSVRKVEPRRGYSPVLKKYVIFPPKQVLDFHPSDSLKEKVKNIGIE